MERRQRTCPVCRACLPGELPGICLRLKAAVEAVAGDRVAARRSEVDQTVAQRRQCLRQQAAPAAAAVVATSTASSGRSAAGNGGIARAMEAALPQAPPRSASRLLTRADAVPSIPIGMGLLEIFVSCHDL